MREREFVLPRADGRSGGALVGRRLAGTPVSGGTGRPSRRG